MLFSKRKRRMSFEGYRSWSCCSSSGWWFSSTRVRDSIADMLPMAFSLGFFKVDSFDASGLIGDVKNGCNGIRVAVDRECLLGCFSGRVGGEVDLPGDVVIGHQ